MIFKKTWRPFAVEESSLRIERVKVREIHQRTCTDLLHKLPNFSPKYHESNRNSYDHVAEVLLVHNC